MKCFLRSAENILDENLAEQFIVKFNEDFDKKIEGMKEKESSKLLDEYLIKFEESMINQYEFNPYLVKCIINEFSKKYPKRLDFENIKKEYLKKKKSRMKNFTMYTIKHRFFYFITRRRPNC